jgi:hypothetical protein
MCPGAYFATGYIIISHLLHGLHRITQLPPTITGELLSAMPLIADQVSTLVSYVFPLLV